MIALGIVLLLVAWLAGVSILWTLGIILIVVGVIIELLGYSGRPVFGVRRWY